MINLDEYFVCFRIFCCFELKKNPTLYVDINVEYAHIDDALSLFLEIYIELRPVSFLRCSCYTYLRIKYHFHELLLTRFSSYVFCTIDISVTVYQYHVHFPHVIKLFNKYYCLINTKIY